MNKIPQKWKSLRVMVIDKENANFGAVFECYKNEYGQKIMESVKTGEKFQFCLDHIRNDKYYTILEVQRGEEQTFYLYDQQQIEKANEYGRKLKTKYDNIHYISGRGNLTIEGYNEREKVA